QEDAVVAFSGSQLPAGAGTTPGVWLDLIFHHHVTPGFLRTGGTQDHFIVSARAPAEQETGPQEPPLPRPRPMDCSGYPFRARGAGSEGQPRLSRRQAGRPLLRPLRAGWGQPASQLSDDGMRRLQPPTQVTAPDDAGTIDHDHHRRALDGVTL